MISNLLRGIIVIGLTSFAGVCLQSTFAYQQDNVEYPASQVKTMNAIGQGIANLRDQFPQLREFSVSKNVLSQRLIITYDYHTHRSQIRGGWRRQVPEPDDDGLWFYIDLHDPASTAQIHTQPVMQPYCFEDKQLSFLILEGKKTKPVSDEIWAILKQHGVRPCDAEYGNK